MTPSLPPRPTTVLFDLDGTVLDSTEPVLTAWATALGAMGLPPLPRAELHRVIGPPTQLSAPELLAERGRDDPAAYDEFIGRFRTTITELEVDSARAYDGVLEVLRRLHEEGRRLAIVTSKPRQSAERVIPALGIEALFVHVEAPDEARPEPKTATMARAAATLDLAADDTVMVGDRHHDVTSATTAGIATIGAAWAAHASAQELREAGAALVVDVPGELLGPLGVAARDARAAAPSTVPTVSSRTRRAQRPRPG